MTDEIKIDPTTGMPELPEGFFWEVYEGEVNHLTLPIVAICTADAKTWADKDNFSIDKQHSTWIGYSDYDYVRYPVVSEDEAPSHFSWRRTGNTKVEVKKVRKQLWRFVDWTYTVKEEVTYYEIENYRVVARVHVQSANFDWTPTSIRLVAETTYKNWRKSVAEQEKQKEIDDRKAKLIGSYPPKTLKGTE